MCRGCAHLHHQQHGKIWICSRGRAQGVFTSTTRNTGAICTTSAATKPAAGAALPARAVLPGDASNRRASARDMYVGVSVTVTVVPCRDRVDRGSVRGGLGDWLSA